MKKLINGLCSLAVTAMLAVSAIIVTPTCWALHYQPEVPESLRK